jgi:predicted permease
MDPVEARNTAERAFGGMARIKEEVRALRGLALIDSFTQDIRSAVRTLLRSPGYTLVVVATLALGVGVNTAIFRVVKEVLLQPLPYADVSRVVLIDRRASTTGGGLSPLPLSVPELEAYRRSSLALESVVEYHSMPFTLLGDGLPERVDTGVVSASFFDVLGVRPLLGRTFVAGEDAVGAEPVLVLSYEYWQRRYRGDAAVVGRILEMNDRSHRVVGVLPPLPRFPEPNDVFMPVSSCPFRSTPARSTSLSSRMVGALARLRDGATPRDASFELAAIAGRLQSENPEAYREIQTHQVSAVPLTEALTRRARPALLLLLATAGFVLLIACSNVSNLHLAELSGRSRELALRAAIGADRLRLMRQLLTESLLLALFGGFLGIVLALAVVGVLVALAERLTPRDLTADLDPGALVFGFCLALAVGLGACAISVLLSRGRTVPRGPALAWLSSSSSSRSRSSFWPEPDSLSGACIGWREWRRDSRPNVSSRCSSISTGTGTDDRTPSGIFTRGFSRTSGRYRESRWRRWADPCRSAAAKAPTPSAFRPRRDIGRFSTPTR